jgi:DnaJ-class molecular chaperone
MTHYETLGLNESASQDEIKRAYRSLASKHHPDKGGDTARFQEIQSAYAAIETEEKRAQYDAERRGGGGFRFNVNGAEFNHVPPGMEDLFAQFGFGFKGHDPFAHVRKQQQQQPKRNKDLRINVGLRLAETLEEQKKVFEVRTTTGQSQTAEITIPRGIQPGSMIKYPGMGDNFFSTLPRGDLHVHIQVMEDPRFQVSGYDLITLIDINCLNAIIGCEQEFQTLDDKTFSITIPPGTQPNTKFKVPAQGLYSANQVQRGNLYLISNIIVPTNLTTEQIDSIRTIAHSK